jgi:hypothetical protein
MPLHTLMNDKRSRHDPIPTVLRCVNQGVHGRRSRPGGAQRSRVCLWRRVFGLSVGGFEGDLESVGLELGDAATSLRFGIDAGGEVVAAEILVGPAGGQHGARRSRSACARLPRWPSSSRRAAEPAELADRGAPKHQLTRLAAATRDTRRVEAPLHYLRPRTARARRRRHRSARAGSHPPRAGAPAPIDFLSVLGPPKVGSPKSFPS